MSSIQERIQNIKTQHLAATGANVLVVEGVDDVDAIRILLNNKFPGVNWEKKWHLEPAGSKQQVLDFLRNEGVWLGLVDRDEWTTAEMTQYKAELPKLNVLPRFCMESYLIDPDELWDAFPDVQRNKIAGGLPALKLAIEVSLQDWTAQAALWHEVRPLWRSLRNLNFPDVAASKPPVISDAQLQMLVLQWQSLFNPAAIVANVATLRGSLQGVPKSQLYSKWIYAKTFYPIVVCQVLNQLLGVKKQKERRNSIFKTRSVPSDLDPLWQAMGLLP